jgi:hypothetical protein
MDFELADHFLRGIYSLGRIALRVTGCDLDLAAFDATCGIDRLGCIAHAAVEADGGRGARSGQRGEPADPNRLGLSDSRARKRERGCRGTCRGTDCKFTTCSFHDFLP